MRNYRHGCDRETTNWYSCSCSGCNSPAHDPHIEQAHTPCNSRASQQGPDKIPDALFPQDNVIHEPIGVGCGHIFLANR